MRRTGYEKRLETEKAREDPLNYQRRDPAIYNPIKFIKYLNAKRKSKALSEATGIPFRETYSKLAYGIPTTEELMRLRQDEERAIMSEIARDAEQQFRESTPRPVKKGYEYQILKS